MRALLERLARRPLHRRVTLLVVALVSVSILVSNLAGYVALRVTLQRASQSVATAMADDLAAPAASSITATGSLGPDLRQAGGTLVEATCTDGRVLRVPGSPGRLVLDPADLRAAASDAEPVLRTGVDEEGHRYTVAAVPAGTTGCALVVGRPLTTLDSILDAQQLVVLNVVLAGLLAAGVASTFVARSGLHPVHQLSDAVQHVTRTRDFQPVSISYAQGDLANLTASFNDLLRTLAETRERQTRLVADAGHELRTPLTSLTTNVDLLRTDLHRDVLTQAQRGRVLDDVGEQLAELSSMVRDLVQLSRDDTATAFRPSTCATRCAPPRSGSGAARAAVSWTCSWRSSTSSATRAGSSAPSRTCWTTR
ncbi:histidine kinase dimerization/phospho-acceptor domain-containing protein [Microlunatus sagamiharensis]|uniref:histidine kinase dimerization/phospho-acceptor domain-containing protein n=1 Tax=Microlunatus sagamiharensis TaxID=546874 RepID=UPI000B86E8B4|nr:histidine kinase dimerization/phospho-acceptor domain-containing protein [Microlunatus sagamiharensis]